VDAADFEALGVYDPGDAHATLRLELLEYLVGLGATADDLVAYPGEMLAALAGVLTIRGGRVMTLAEAAEYGKTTVDDLRWLLRAAGLPDPDPDARVVTEAFATLVANASVATELLGEEPLEQLLRVMGAAMSRVADAVVSAFLVNIEPAARRQDPVGLAVARANVEATSLLPLVPLALDVLFRQHLLVAQRSTLADADLVGYETQHRVVGFVDLVGSTELSELLSLRDLGGALRTFETLAMDTVRTGGGRVIKLIGDEVLFTAPDARSACRIAVDLAQACREDDLLPDVRAGLADGTVMLRDGDVFGPVVNLAARIVHLAQPGEVVATSEVADQAGLPHVRRGQYELKGIAAQVELATIVPA
jgi:class 3 adenylate cyclase